MEVGGTLEETDRELIMKSMASCHDKMVGGLKKLKTVCDIYDCLCKLKRLPCLKRFLIATEPQLAGQTAAL